MTRGEIPARMRHLERDRRGYPVPVIVQHDSDGRPLLAVNDEAAKQRVWRHDLCSVCGQKLNRGRWFVGGVGSAFHENGAFFDPPMHDECLHYSLQVCPYLAAPRYAALGLDILKTVKAKDLMAVNTSPDDERPALFVAVMGIAERINYSFLDGIRFADTVAIRPGAVRRVELWRHGQRLAGDDAAEARRWIAAELKQKYGSPGRPDMWRALDDEIFTEERKGKRNAKDRSNEQQALYRL